MLYWLIPYLIAFNSTGSENWTNGPEYLFKADMEAGIRLENNVTMMTNYELDFSCKPLNESSIRCRVESMEVKDTETPEDDSTQEKKEIKRDSNITDWNFEVQFNRAGLHSIAFLNTEEGLRRNMIRAIFEVINIGPDFISGVKIGDSLLSNEKSSVGVCDAMLHVQSSPHPVESAAPRVGLYMDVPSFTERSENDTLVISKERDVQHCSVKEPYFFSNHPVADDKMNYNVTVSETVIFFGRDFFGGATSKLGTLTSKREHPDQPTEVRSGHVKEIIRVRLEATRGAPEKL